MIKKLTKEKFVNIATNGINIDLYGKYVEDYIQNLIKFVEEVSKDYYVTDFDTDWCEISKRGLEIIRVCFEKNKVIFYLPKEKPDDLQHKSDISYVINVVYMHSNAWEAINNNGKINQPIDIWPV